MDLNLTPQEQQFRDEFRAWLEANIPEGWGTTDAHAPEDSEERFGFLRAWQKKMYEAGWVGIHWPKQYGGRGATLIEQTIFIEEMARANAPPLINVLGLSLLGPTLIAYGTEAQKKRFLANILSADEIWCQGYSEPNAGSDLAALRSEAVLDGDHFVVNGQKTWTSFGHFADWCFGIFRTDPDAPKHKGLTYLLVDMHSPGLSVRPLKQMTGESEFNEVFFKDVRVPVENVVGRVNDGWNIAIATLMFERGTLGASLQITFKRQIERLIELSRRVDRNGQPASSDPVIRQKLAQIYTEIEIFRLNQMRTLTRMSKTGVPGPEGSIQKIFWSEMNQRMQQVAMEMLGPYGQLTRDCSYAVDHGQWAHAYLRSRGNTIEAGTSEIQRNIIGHFVLGLPKSY
ncbi:MAG TPA: acyl-CoA dehydrogenase [Blastocatellia bacterium]|nr:acyl-CoA dehydrogenase [Blastocatellia bacterium]